MGNFNANSLKGAVRSAKRPTRLNDGDNLYLKLGATGQSWVLRYQLHGKRRDLGLGRYPDVGLADARDAALKARLLIRTGVDPVTKRREEQALAVSAQETDNARTFEQQAGLYIEAHAHAWKNKKHKQQWENTLEQYVYPIMGHKDVAEINTQDVLAVLQPIWVEKNETASRIRSRIELVINAARARGYRAEPNPAIWRGHLDALLPKPSKVQRVRHHPAMPWQELPDFWKKLAEYSGHSVSALKFLILTATRTTEVRNAQWDEFDDQACTWTIPAARMKAGKAHTVPLSDEAAQLIDEQRDQHGVWVFPGARGKSGLSNMAMAMLLRDIAPDYTVHGFRSSFRVWGAEETNHPTAVLEMALAHTIRNATEAAYQRSDLLSRRRSLMCDWAEFVTGVKRDV